MWVFIRPGVVRSANEEKVKLGREFCPIHRFDGNDQIWAFSRQPGPGVRATAPLTTPRLLAHSRRRLKVDDSV